MVASFNILTTLSRPGVSSRSPICIDPVRNFQNPAFSNSVNSAYPFLYLLFRVFCAPVIISMYLS